MPLSRKYKLTVIVLLSLTFLQPFFSAQNFSPASDETTHIPSGYTYIKTGELKLNPQHPPLVKILAGLPLMLTNINFDSSDPTFSGPLFNEWLFGKKFLASNNIGKILTLSRLPIQLLSVLLAFYLFLWASEMFGRKAGLLAIFIYAFMPNMIAHSQFVTMDIAVSAFSLIAMYHLWKFFKTSHISQLVYSGIFLGLSLASKFSAIVFLPVVAGFLLIYVWIKSKDTDAVIRNYIIYGFILTAVSFFIVYGLYFFPKDLSFYIRGLRSVYADWSGNHYFYLNGDFSTNGWWYYFILAFLMKTPIPFLVILFAAFTSMFLRKYNLNNWDKFFLLIPALFFLIVTTVRAGDIGVRYILPIYPFLILFVSGFLSQLIQSLKIKMQSDSLKSKVLNPTLKFYILRFTLLILSVWYVSSAVTAYPDYLPYFNESVGGSSNGYKHLDDSNIEWGQDLKRLKQYQLEHPETKTLISWNYAELNYYEIKNNIEVNKDSLDHPTGRYAVNVHLLIHLIQKSEEYKDPALNWLKLYKPVDKIGQSFFIYDFK